MKHLASCSMILAFYLLFHMEIKMCLPHRIDSPLCRIWLGFTWTWSVDEKLSTVEPLADHLDVSDPGGCYVGSAAFLGHGERSVLCDFTVFLLHRALNLSSFSPWPWLFVSLSSQYWWMLTRMVHFFKFIQFLSMVILRWQRKDSTPWC